MDDGVMIIVIRFEFVFVVMLLSLNIFINYDLEDAKN